MIMTESTQSQLVITTHHLVLHNHQNHNNHNVVAAHLHMVAGRRILVRVVSGARWPVPIGIKKGERGAQNLFKYIHLWRTPLAHTTSAHP